VSPHRQSVEWFAKANNQSTFLIHANYRKLPRMSLSPKPNTELSTIIRMAWEDRTTFDEIREKTGLCEADVIRTMRRALKPSSFRLWRQRVTGRVTKHRAQLAARMHVPEC
jgi:uncharacterized protein (TIGR03643 family)